MWVLQTNYQSFFTNITKISSGNANDRFFILSKVKGYTREDFPITITRTHYRIYEWTKKKKLLGSFILNNYEVSQIKIHKWPGRNVFALSVRCAQERRARSDVRNSISAHSWAFSGHAAEIVLSSVRLLDLYRKWTRNTYLYVLEETLKETIYFSIYVQMKVRNSSRERVPGGIVIERDSAVKGNVKTILKID